jgi:hypothetical protein
LILEMKKKSNTTQKYPPKSEPATNDVESYEFIQIVGRGAFGCVYKVFFSYLFYIGLAQTKKVNCSCQVDTRRPKYDEPRNLNTSRHGSTP